VLPILAIGRALVARGHQCAVVAHSFFTPETRAAGLEPLPIATAVRYEDIVRQPDLFHRYRGPRLVGRMLEDAIVPTVDALRAEIARRRPDVLLTHYILLGAQWLAEAERLPCAVVVLSPVGWLSATDPVPALQIAPGGPAAALAAVGMRVLHPVVRAMTDRWANAMRAATGFPPGRDLLWTDMRGGDASLGMWSSAFRPACRDDPPRGVICGLESRAARPRWAGSRPLSRRS
jgi:UDP:flavonoid glycosyltransferase YjiC (YdhE family)